MAYTEVRNIKGRKYYYRVLSVRNKKKVSKKRIYLGIDLSKNELLEKEGVADKKLLLGKREILNKEIEKIKPKIIKILKKNNIKRAGIFGSYARGEQKKNSDIDIAVKIDDKNMSLLGFIRIMQALEEELKRRVDLVEYKAIKPRLKEKILNEEIKII